MSLFRMMERSSEVHPPDISHWIPFDPLWTMRLFLDVEEAVLAVVAPDADQGLSWMYEFVTVVLLPTL
jgi:hypothetical protein